MTVIPYSTTPSARATAPSILDRLLISAGTALADWGVRRATRHAVPDFGDQTAAFEARRETAARILPMLPR
ncbi:hypothetical protein G3T36_11810 [Diaminobutyricibacter tongyongensis]|uniref:Uncharacterized protein n=1 Tax=Leifsonia tongyongensis TaxID=1268043 RepID=A0A6L9XZU3_9MICO|nr:hypothetical protein [Diaminobutyricibacter tongyongensis]NEN06554.1 hypothetical protein [Diaminobutyricibacter tongyongensis]